MKCLILIPHTGGLMGDADCLFLAYLLLACAMVAYQEGGQVVFLFSALHSNMAGSRKMLVLFLAHLLLTHDATAASQEGGPSLNFLKISILNF